MDLVLRHVTEALVHGDATSAGRTQALRDDLAQHLVNSGESSAIRESVEYVRDRVGVPRDMSFPAARQFRAHLNWAIDALP